MAGADQDDSLDWLCELLGRPPPLDFALGSALAPVPLPPPFPAPALAQVPSPLPPPVNDAAALAVEDDSDVEVWLRELTSLPPPPPPDADAEAMAWLREWIARPSAAPAAAPAAPAAAPAAPAAATAAPVRIARSRSPRAARAAATSSASSLAALRPRRIVEVGVPPSSRRFSAAGLAAVFPGLALAVPQQGTIVREFLLSGPPTAGSAPFDTVLDLCLARLARWLSAFESMMVFKVGICHDPEYRWLNRDYGYVRERCWHAMDLVYAGTSEECRQLEIGIIAATQSVSGSYNVKPGGEGVAAGSASCATCYVYFVVAGAGHGIGLTVAWAQRRRALLVSRSA